MTKPESERGQPQAPGGPLWGLASLHAHTVLEEEMLLVSGHRSETKARGYPRSHRQGARLGLWCLDHITYYPWASFPYLGPRMNSGPTPHGQR